MNKIQIALLAILTVLPSFAVAQSTSHNYVKTATMLDAEGNDSLQAIQYYNGLGYPTLSVATVGAPDATVYSLTTYDGCGREKIQYAPVPGTTLDYINETNVLGRGISFYMDNKAFTQNHYDALDRATDVDIAGYRWRNAGKKNHTEYSANTPNDNVLHYEATADGDNGLILPANTSYQYYPVGSLRKETVYDADNKSVTVFTDLNGNKILERTAAGDTYYVYNALGQLRFVLPPAFQNSGNNTIFAYEYRYDNRGRISKKTLPQGGTTQYWYDKADRVAFMKDPALGTKYRFYLYDKVGRLCVQGTCRTKPESSSVLATATYTGGNSGIRMTGYSAPYNMAVPKIEIVNYYDNYNFMDGDISDNMPTVNINNNQQGYAVGSLTGSVVYATNGEALATINVYDQKGLVVRSVRKGLGGLLEDVATSYTFTGAVDSFVANVDVAYGSSFIAETDYTYSHGMKSDMRLSVSHGLSSLSRNTRYSYDAIGRLIGKNRQLTNSSNSNCSYSYDVHGWLTDINNGGFIERLSYANGLEDSYYNGNISTVEWKAKNDGAYSGYNLKYDDSNRLYNAIFGSGNNLSGNRNYFNEYAEYDENGNITRLQRRGLVDKMHGGFGLVDNLYMTYNGNQLTSVRDNASHQAYAGATDFNGVQYQEYPLAYNSSGSLVSDAGRNIAKISYDNLNNPTRIQFTDGNVTKYTYSATGEKLRVIYQTAVPNINVAIGSTRELLPSEIQYTDSIDYLLGGSLTLRNGRIDKYQFDEGYCQAERYSSTADAFTFCYYDMDHLGNIRQVTEADGSSTGEIIQTNNYYPFGAQFCDGTAVNNVQSRKYNGKEFDNMHGLNTYDYGARQYNPVTARWDRIDPLAHKYYSVSPYAYCMNNPIKFIDPDGRALGDYINSNGDYIASDGIDDGKLYVLKTTMTNFETFGDVAINGISEEEANSIITKKDISNKNNFVEIVGSQDIRKKAISLIEDDGLGGTAANNNREYKITFAIGETDSECVYVTKGPTANLSTDKTVSIAIGGDPSLVYIHSHPSGTDGSKYWIQAPSEQDVTNASSNVSYVIGMGDKTVYMYNNSGIMATLPLEIFTSF